MTKRESKEVAREVWNLTKRACYYREDGRIALALLIERERDGLLSCEALENVASAAECGDTWTEAAHEYALAQAVRP